MSENEELQRARDEEKQARAKRKQLEALAAARILKKDAEETIQRLEMSHGAERPTNSTSEASPAPLLKRLLQPTSMRAKAEELSDLLSGMGWIFIIAGVGLLALKFLYGWEFLFTYIQLFAVGIVFLIGGSFLEALLKPKEPEKTKRRKKREE
jgi:hypothetical protein